MITQEAVIDKTDTCFDCGATAQFHLQNPFGVYWRVLSGSRYYYGWNNKLVGVRMMTCPEYVNGDTNTLDHETLYNVMSRV